jgi:TolB-like protein
MTGSITIGLLAVCALAAFPADGVAQRIPAGEGFDAGIDRIAATFAPALSGKTVAVFEFPDLQGRVSDLSRMISEQLTTELVRRLSTEGTVVERRQVRQVLAELNLQKTDLTAAEVAAVGRQLGADAIILGTQTVLGSQLVVNARAVTVTGGRVVAAERMSVQPSQELLELAHSGLDLPDLTRTRAPEAPLAPPPSAPSQPPPPAPPPAPVRQSVTTGTITLVLNGCTQRADEVHCSLSVTSTKDKPFGIIDFYALEPSRMVDPDGNIHPLAKATVGGRGSADLVPGVPMAATLDFDNVPRIDSIPLIEIFWFDQDRDDGQAVSARFLNVPVRR